MPNARQRKNSAPPKTWAVRFDYTKHQASGQMLRSITPRPSEYNNILPHGQYINPVDPETLTVESRPFLKMGRNSKCLCGSRKRFKNCHMEKKT